MRIDATENVFDAFSSLSLKNNDEIEGRKNFGEILELTLGDAESAESQNKISSAELLSGDDTTIHDIMIDSEKAELTLNFVIQVRNKMLDAYNSVMKMQV